MNLRKIYITQLVSHYIEYPLTLLLPEEHKNDYLYESLQYMSGIQRNHSRLSPLIYFLVTKRSAIPFERPAVLSYYCPFPWKGVATLIENVKALRAY